MSKDQKQGKFLGTINRYEITLEGWKRDEAGAPVLNHTIKVLGYGPEDALLCAGRKIDQYESDHGVMLKTSNPTVIKTEKVKDVYSRY